MSVVSALDFGAMGDGQANDTAALQAAVDHAHQTGGGRVTLPAGHRFRCGSLELKSRVELHLERSSELVAAEDIEAFDRRFVVGALAGGVSRASTEATAAMIWAEGASDIAITGGGTVNGSAAAYIRAETEMIYRMTNARPFPVFLIDCERVDLRDVHFVDAALWTVRLSGCRQVSIVAVRIDNDMRVPNSDGIDLDHCRRVQVVGCDIRCPDDAISLKTTDEYVRFGPCEDIVITGCTLQSRSNAVTLGVDADSPIRNVVVTGCTIRDSHRGVSVSVGTGRDGYVENVLFSDLIIETRHDDDDWWGGGEPIVVRSAPWHDQAGAVRHVRFRNILARSENGVLIYAGAGGEVEDIEISDVRLELGRWTKHPGHRLDLRPFDHAPIGADQYRPALLFDHPPAIRVVGASRVRIRDVVVTWTDPAAAEFGPALSIDQSHDVQWRDLELANRSGRGQLRTDGSFRDLAVSGPAE